MPAAPEPVRIAVTQTPMSQTQPGAMRADHWRSHALAAVVGMGTSNGSGPERLRTVIYFTGDPAERRDDLSRYRAYVQGRHWQVTTVRTDRDEAEYAWMRKGLLSATTLVCYGVADGVAIPESVFDALSQGDQAFILHRLHRYGGFLHIIPSEGKESS